MTSQASAVYIQLKTQNIVSVLQCLDVLRQNNIEYNILDTLPIEETKPKEKVNENLLYKKKLGRYGMKVLVLLAKGYTYNDIAEEMEISIDGVRYYIKKIFKSLNVNNGRDAVRIYLTEMEENQLV